MEKDLCILNIASLKIGYTAGGHEKLILPPLNAQAGQGELIALIGRNGIGKSTLLRTITGLQPALGGNIFYNGLSIKSFSRIDLARTVGYISTEVVRVSNMSVRELVALGRFPHTDWIGKLDVSDNEAVNAALERAGMSDFSSRYIYELSDGERQRAMIARILAQDTPVMIMDEPTAFLDIGSKYEILHLMHQLTQENGKTIIFSTHDLQMAISQSDKIWLISGNTLTEGSPEDLLLKGSFDHLFDSSLVKFNAEQGTFLVRSDEKGKIHIKGEGPMRLWTERAVNRAGFVVCSEMTQPFIKSPGHSNDNWTISNNGVDIKFNSLYELVKFLNALQGRSNS